MTTEAVTRFFALLAMVAELATATAVILFAGGKVSPALRRFGRQAADTVAPSALSLAACVAAVCTAGSLYLSEVAGFLPCKLCWYQRFAMYPLVPVVGLAAWKGITRLRPYAFALATIGPLVSVYHILIERGVVKESASCDPTNPCSLNWVPHLGYLTIPTMALSGFLLILTLLAVSWAGNRPGSGSPDPETSRSEVHGPH